MIDAKKKEVFEAFEKKDLARFTELLKEDGLADSENENGLKLLGLACHYGEAEFVNELLKKGANLNALSHSKLSFIPSNTALHAAIAGKQSAEIVELLIAHGADVNAVDSDGHTPLQTAAFEGNTEIAGLLIKSGANISARGGQGRALTIAKVKNHPAFIDLLNKN